MCNRVLVQAFLAASPRPDMRRLRLLRVVEDLAESAPERTAWQLIPWGPANNAVSEGYELETLNLCT